MGSKPLKYENLRNQLPHSLPSLYSLLHQTSVRIL